MASRWLLFSILIGLLTLAVACGSEDDDPAALPGTDAQAATEADEAEAEAGDQSQSDAVVSAADLEFEVREVQSLDALGEIEWRVTIGVPADWVAQQPDDFPGLFRPPDAFLVPQLWIGAGSCSGSCGARTIADWPAQLDSGDWSQYLNEERFNVRRAEDLPGGGRLLEVDNRTGRVTFLVAMFQDNAEHYFSCLYQTEQDDDPPAGARRGQLSGRLDRRAQLVALNHASFPLR